MPGNLEIQQQAAQRTAREQRAEEARLMYQDAVGDQANGIPPMTYRAIAEKYDCSLRTVQNRLNTHMPKILEGPAEQYRQVEVQKLDEMEEKAWEVLQAKHLLVQQGKVVFLEDPDTGHREPVHNHEPVLKALNMLLRIAHRRSALMGLDQPQQVHATVTQLDPMDAGLQAILDEARRRAAREKRLLENQSS